MSLFETNDPYVMREPCRACAATDGVIEERGGQQSVRCINGHWVYNAPKTETGLAQRSITTIHNGIKPSQRARILDWALGRCELCGGMKNLHVSHLLAVKDGFEAGLTDQEINSDGNLAALCEECNLGLSSLSISPLLYVVLLRNRASR